MLRVWWTLTHSGTVTTLRKMVRTLRRYGFMPYKMCENIRMYARILKRYNIIGTLFVPAKIVMEYKEIFKDDLFENIRIGVHGYMHIDYSKLTPIEQKEHFQKAREIFSSLGMNEVGFRAPYMRLNKEAVAILASLNYAFDSSSVFVYEKAITNKNVLKRIQADHNIVKRSSCYPYVEDGIVRIPFILPDDEVLVDKLNYTPTRIKSIWCDIINNIEKFGNIAVLQIHPHRIRELSYALEYMINVALKNEIEIIDLYTLAKRYKNGIMADKKYLCITGDIDALSLKEFIR